MKQNKTWLLAALALAVVLAGAGTLYSRLSGSVEADSLTPQTAGDQEAGEEAEAVQAPDFTVYDGSGSAVQLSDYFGKPIVLNFWASWCGPCKSEMPDFDDAYAQQGEEIQFLMVNSTIGRETQEKARSYVEEAGYAFPVLYDLDGDATETYGVYSLPTTYFIDAEGDLIARASGMIGPETLQEGIGMIAPGGSGET